VGKFFEKINVKVSPQSRGFCRGEVVWAYIGKSKTGAQESIESDHHPTTLTPRTPGWRRKPEGSPRVFSLF